MSTEDIALLLFYGLVAVTGVTLFSIVAGWVFDAYDEWRNEE